MNNIQKWLIVIAVLISAIGIFLGGLRGRYYVDWEEKGLLKRNTWTGETYYFVPYSENKKGGWKLVK